MIPDTPHTAIVTGAAASALGFTQGRPESWWLVVSTLGVITMTISTLIINAPVNAAIDTWDAAAPPPDWAQKRDRWERGHALRSYVGLVALLCSCWPACCPDAATR